MPQKKNKDGYFRSTFVIGKKPDGKPERVTIRAKTKRELDEKLSEAKRLHGKGISSKDTTVSEWAETWLRVYKANATDGQKKQYRSDIVNHIVPAIGKMEIRDVRASVLQEFLNSYAGGRLGTVQKIRITLKQLFEEAEEEGLIERSPARRLTLPNLIEETRRPLTEVERDAVCKVALFHARGAYVLTMMYCGLRRGEALALAVSDVDLEKRKLNVDKSLGFKTGNQGRIKRTTKDEPGTKSWSSIRIVPIPDILIPYLEKQMQGKSTDNSLFPKKDGNHATGVAADNWWDSYMRQCHIAAGAQLYRNQVQLHTSPFSSIITPHFLRHTYATDIYAAGVDEIAQRIFLGHSSKDITDRYRQMSDTAFYRALELINKYHEETCAKYVPDWK